MNFQMFKLVSEKAEEPDKLFNKPGVNFFSAAEFLSSDNSILN